MTEITNVAIKIRAYVSPSPEPGFSHTSSSLKLIMVAAGIVRITDTIMYIGKRLSFLSNGYRTISIKSTQSIVLISDEKVTQRVDP